MLLFFYSLDREIELPIPSSSDREEILTKMLNQHDLTKDIIKNVASVAHGYVGADLGAVVSQAYVRAIQFNNGVLTDEHLEWALTQVKPSAMREIYVQVPNVSKYIFFGLINFLSNF